MSYSKIILFASLVSVSVFADEETIVTPGATIIIEENTFSSWNPLSDVYSGIQNWFAPTVVIEVAPETQVIIIEEIIPNVADVSVNASSLWSNLTGKCAAVKTAIATKAIGAKDFAVNAYRKTNDVIVQDIRGKIIRAKDSVINRYNATATATKNGVNASWKATTNAFDASKEMVNSNVAATTAFIKAHPYKVAIASTVAVAALVVAYQAGKKSCDKNKESKS